MRVLEAPQFARAYIVDHAVFLAAPDYASGRTLMRGPKLAGAVDLGAFGALPASATTLATLNLPLPSLALNEAWLIDAFDFAPGADNPTTCALLAAEASLVTNPASGDVAIANLAAFASGIAAGLPLAQIGTHNVSSLFVPPLLIAGRDVSYAGDPNPQPLNVLLEAAIINGATATTAIWYARISMYRIGGVE